MNDSIRYNTLISLRFRKRLNAQKNTMILEGGYDQNHILQPYRYIIGLGEKHYKKFDKEIKRLSGLFPWIIKKHIRLILNELILNSQFSMLREVIRKVPLKKKVAGYFYLTLYICDSFLSAGIEEFGDFFDYYDYMETHQFFLDEEAVLKNYFDEKMESKVKSVKELTEQHVKVVLTPDNKLIHADRSNKFGLNIIEDVTDHDFFITSFYKNGLYMWKRLHLRVENDHL